MDAAPLQNFQELDRGTGSILHNTLSSRKLSDLLIPVTNSQGNEPGRSAELLLYGRGEACPWQKIQEDGQCAVLTFATSVAQGFCVCHHARILHFLKISIPLGSLSF